MRQKPIVKIKFIIPFFSAFFCIVSARAQGIVPGPIDFQRDIIPEAVAKSGRDMFIHDLLRAGPGGKDSSSVTRRITLPVNKLKAIMDSCTKHNVTEVDVFFMTIRASDLPHIKMHNPGKTDSDLMGKQMLVMRVPRNAFANAPMASATILSKNSLMLSLLSAGLIVFDYLQKDLPADNSIYFSFGTIICPPPNMCD